MSDWQGWQPRTTQPTLTFGSSPRTWGSNSTHLSRFGGIGQGAPITTEPYLSGEGPAEFSTCTEVAIVPGWVFDVCSYYKDLGAPASTSTTRKQLREAYQARDGQSSVRLTYCLKQLLDPKVRYVYDRCTLEDGFVDEYVMAFLNRQLKERLAATAQAFHDQGHILPDEVGEQISSDFWSKFTEDESNPQEALDPAPEMGKDLASNPANPFPFSYYLWRTRTANLEDLAAWRDLLVSAFGAARISTRISVGQHSNMPHRWLLGTVGDRVVAYLRQGEAPTVEMAQAVATEWHRRQTDDRKILPS